MFTPNEKPVDILHAGQVGYVMSTMKDPADAPIGDTVFKPEDAAVIEPFEGEKTMLQLKDVKKTNIFASIFSRFLDWRTRNS